MHALIWLGKVYILVGSPSFSQLQRKINHAVFHRLYAQHLQNSPYTAQILATSAQRERERERERERGVERGKSSAGGPSSSSTRTWKFMAPSMLYRQPPVAVPSSNPATGASSMSSSRGGGTGANGGAGGGLLNQGPPETARWRPVPKQPEMVELEKRAYEFANRAMKVAGWWLHDEEKQNSLLLFRFFISLIFLSCFEKENILLCFSLISTIFINKLIERFCRLFSNRKCHHFVSHALHSGTRIIHITNAGYCWHVCYDMISVSFQFSVFSLHIHKEL